MNHYYLNGVIEYIFFVKLVKNINKFKIKKFLLFFNIF